MSAPEVRLVALNESHIGATYGWVCDDELRRDFLMRGQPTPEGHQAYFAAVLADETQRVYAVTADGKHVGNAGLKHLYTQPGTAEMWVYLGERTSRGRGFGSRATAALLDTAFREFGLDMVYLHVADFNVAARHMYEQLGFIYVPLAPRDASAWDGRGFAVLRMEIGRQQWM